MYDSNNRLGWAILANWQCYTTIDGYFGCIGTCYAACGRQDH